MNNQVAATDTVIWLEEPHVARASEGCLEPVVLPLAQNQKASREVNVFDKTKPTNNYNLSAFPEKKENLKKK